jgi:hypothetical protein
MASYTYRRVVSLFLIPIDQQFRAENVMEINGRLSGI